MREAVRREASGIYMRAMDRKMNKRMQESTSIGWIRLGTWMGLISRQTCRLLSGFSEDLRSNFTAFVGTVKSNNVNWLMVYISTTVCPPSTAHPGNSPRTRHAQLAPRSAILSHFECNTATTLHQVPDECESRGSQSSGTRVLESHVLYQPCPNFVTIKSQRLAGPCLIRRQTLTPLPVPPVVSTSSCD